MSTIRLVSLVLAAGLILGGVAEASVQPATVSGPLGDRGSKLRAPANASRVDLASQGYVEEEFFASGTARGTRAGRSAPAHPDDPFTTRFVVRRPKDISRFNGTVLLDWMNVSTQNEIDMEWIEGHRALMHEGFAYVAVTAQQVSPSPQVLDPVRYAGMDLPGSQTERTAPEDGGPAYSESMVVQIAQALKTPGNVNALGGAVAKHVIASGESQSAQRLSCYVRVSQDADRVFDGFLFDHGECDSRGMSAWDYDPSVPSLFVLGELESRRDQRPAKNLRVWQIAGAAHVDNWIDTYAGVGIARNLTGADVAWDAEAAGRWGLEGGAGGVCALTNAVDPVRANQLPQHYVHDAAIVALHRWITTGLPPVQPPNMAFDPAGTAATGSYPGVPVRADEHGNAIGGLRMPQMDVPVARYVGADRNCPVALIGTTEPFDDGKLLKLYPTFADYRGKLCEASARAIREGTLLPFDAKDIDRRAAAGASRWPADRRTSSPADATCATAFSTPVPSLPVVRSCASRRIVRLTVARGAKVTASAGKVRVRGRRVTLDLRGVRRTQVTVRVRDRGSKRVTTRRFNTCIRRGK